MVPTLTIIKYKNFRLQYDTSERTYCPWHAPLSTWWLVQYHTSWPAASRRRVVVHLLFIVTKPPRNGIKERPVTDRQWRTRSPAVENDDPMVIVRVPQSGWSWSVVGRRVYRFLKRWRQRLDLPILIWRPVALRKAVWKGRLNDSMMNSLLGTYIHPKFPICNQCGKVPIKFSPCGQLEPKPVYGSCR